MITSATELLREFLESLLTDREFAARYAEDPTGTLAAQGLTDVDLSTVDVPAAVSEAADAPDVSDETRIALQSYTGGGPAGGSAGGVAPAAAIGTQSVEHVAQHLNYVTYA
ncbi:MAG TPA: hypothetical protein VH502_06335, partial [Actinoplanes sp.]